ncbi:MAG: STAS domain-containing protein [Proteobacteria bacterium]|nr:STAS domain-containing protein [Pseudomonadota bacterium]MDA1024010.1 STAS domain-containing protein [Pseudomonadota bacterium]
MSNLQTADQSIGIARIVGPIDIDHARKTRRLLLAGLASRENLLVDMSAVTEIDSAGVASLVEALNTARKNRKAFALFNVGYPVMRMLRLARLDKAFTILSGAPGVRIN